jgi:hypothetical protein
MSLPYCRRPTSELLAGTPSLVLSEADALAVIDVARCRPDRPQLIGLALVDRRGHTIVVCDDADHPDAVLHGTEYLCHYLHTALGRPGELIVATVRPGGGPLGDDLDRWDHADAIADDFGCELLEWFVMAGAETWRPREGAADPPRW